MSQAAPKDALSLQLAVRVTRTEVAACAEAFRRMGTAIAGDPTDRPWGRTLFVRDPDGNVGAVYADL